MMVTLNRAVIKRVIVGVDWGYTNPGVMSVYALDGDRRMYLVHEIYRTRQLIGWWVSQAQDVRDHFHPEVFVCDPAEPAYIAEFGKGHLPVVKGFNEIAPGIQAVQERLKAAGDGRARLYVLHDAVVDVDQALLAAHKPASTAQEFESYVWPTGVDGKPQKEVPVDDNNHGMDACRYSVCYVDKIGSQSKGLVTW